MNRRKLALLLPLLALSALATDLRAVSGEVTATEGQRHEVSSYRIETTDTPETLVVLLGPGRAEVGRMNVMPMGDEGFTAHFENATDGFTFEWAPRQGRLVLTTRDGKTAVMTYNRFKKRYHYTPESLAVFKTFGSEVRRIGAAMADLEDAFVWEQDPGPGGDTGGIGISCHGPTVRGSSMGLSRSRCCSAARQSANNSCSNGLCWGCCSLDSCDAICAPNMGDYFCACGVDGTSCG